MGRGEAADAQLPPNLFENHVFALKTVFATLLPVMRSATARHGGAARAAPHGSVLSPLQRQGLTSLNASILPQELCD